MEAVRQVIDRDGLWRADEQDLEVRIGPQGDEGAAEDHIGCPVASEEVDGDPAATSGVSAQTSSTWRPS